MNVDPQKGTITQVQGGTLWYMIWLTEYTAEPSPPIGDEADFDDPVGNIKPDPLMATQIPPLVATSNSPTLSAVR